MLHLMTLTMLLLTLGVLLRMRRIEEDIIKQYHPLSGVGGSHQRADTSIQDPNQKHW